jgi:hypothetical protein
MQRCSKCEQIFDSELCPVCAKGAPDSAQTRQKINESLKKFSVVLVAGLFGILLAVRLYPPLDMNPVMGIALVWFFIPVVVHISLSVRKRLGSHTALVRKIYAWVGVGLVMFAAFVFLNGALDKYPPVQAHARVARKSASRGRSGTSYSVIVAPSWREGGMKSGWK